MIDLQRVKYFEASLSHEGVLWINLDGCCAIRIQEVEGIFLSENLILNSESDFCADPKYFDDEPQTAPSQERLAKMADIEDKTSSIWTNEFPNEISPYWLYGNWIHNGGEEEGLRVIDVKEIYYDGLYDNDGWYFPKTTTKGLWLKIEKPQLPKDE